MKLIEVEVSPVPSYAAPAYFQDKNSEKTKSLIERVVHEFENLEEEDKRAVSDIYVVGLGEDRYELLNEAQLAQMNNMDFTFVFQFRQSAPTRFLRQKLTNKTFQVSILFENKFCISLTSLCIMLD